MGMLPPRWKKIYGDIIRIVILAFLVFLVFVPIFLMLSFSFRSYNSILTDFWSLPERLAWSNYTKAFGRIYHGMLNSLFIVVIGAGASVFLASMNGYVAGTLEFPGKKAFVASLLALMMVPEILALTTTFILINDLGLIDSWFGLWLPWIAGGQIMGSVIMMTFIRNQAKELFEAARIDGAGEFLCFIRISFPLCLPIVVALFISNVINLYNQFIWPLIVINTPAKQVLMVELIRLQDSTTNRLFSVQIAGFVIASLPLLILFIVGMKQFVEGLSSGALKA